MYIDNLSVSTQHNHLSMYLCYTINRKLFELPLKLNNNCIIAIKQLVKSYVCYNILNNMDVI